MESTPLISQLETTIGLLNTLMTPLVIVMGLFLAYRFMVRYERNQERSLYLARETSVHGGTRITVNNEQAPTGGYDFVQVSDEFKPVFLDAMNGFSDYARLKGYEVELSIDNSQSGKVGLRFTILDKGVTVSTNTVRKDVQEYIQKFRDDADFSNMPMAQNAAEHAHLVAALSARFTHMKAQIELHKITQDHLKFVLSEVRSIGLGGIGYQPAQSITLAVTNDGGKNMRDSYNAENSQNIAQGKDASATTTASSVQIGSNHNERAERIQALKDFVIDAQKSEVPENVKGEVVRYIENAREEMEQSAEPDAGFIGKWLGRAETTLSAADAGSNLYTKLLPLLALFGLS
ncbi:hypothetical protein GOB27_14450 [Sinorhizobium meliloti]|nr:hypothetical protein [Sinorhizobium meliloti]